MTLAERDVEAAIAGAEKAARAMARKQGLEVRKASARYSLVVTDTGAAVLAEGTLSQMISYLNARQLQRKA